MATFNDWVSTELPLRPFVSTDGAAGQTLVRSTNPLAPRELVWADAAAGAKGDTGAAGQSAYQIAVSLGFVGTEAQWLASLQGAKGDTGAAGKDGINGTNGADGASAFALAQTLGFTGTLSEWLASLKGATGDQGIQGIQGVKGDTGAAGKDGVKGDTGLAGQSAYDIAVALGFVGDQTAWLASLRGATGTVDTTLLTNEVTRATTAENTIAANLAAETTARITADQAIQNAITALTADVNDLKTNEAGEIIGVSQSALDAAIAAEATLRANADNDLASRIAAIPAGPKGDTGEAGASAYQIAVALGYQGTEGDWLTTLVGPKGDQGIQGVKGDQGLSIKGDKGDIGPKGDTGLTGLSAYQIATFNGFVGSEVDWLISLKGPKGDKGADGTGTSIVYQTPLVGVDVNTTGTVDSLDFTQYSQGVWDVVIQTFNRIRRFTVASLYNGVTNKLSYTTYGIIGDVIHHAVTIGYDTLTNTLKLYIQNKDVDTFIVSALRYPVKNS